MFIYKKVLIYYKSAFLL